MGGGQGTRLFPLTRERSKPAVPLAGKYRLVIPDLQDLHNQNQQQRHLERKQAEPSAYAP